jgi:hypothetical protein
MAHSTASSRPSLLRGPLVIVVLFLLALMALYPGATLRAQGTLQTAAVRVDTLNGEVHDMYVKGKSLEVRYHNSGTVSADIVGEIQVRDEADELIVAVPLVESRRIAAGKRETFRVAMPTLPPGKYTIYAVVDFGGAELTAAQAALEIRP